MDRAWHPLWGRGGPGPLGDTILLGPWTSTLHRVLPPTSDEPGAVRRRSIARFLDCPPDLVVECIPTCCGPDWPARYEPVSAGVWLREKLLGGRVRRRPDLREAAV